MIFKKKREIKEQEIGNELKKQLDLSDERVRKRLLIECSRQELFTTKSGIKFLNECVGKQPESVKGKKIIREWFACHRKKIVIIAGVILIAIGVKTLVIDREKIKESTVLRDEEQEDDLEYDLVVDTDTVEDVFAESIKDQELIHSYTEFEDKVTDLLQLSCSKNNGLFVNSLDVLEDSSKRLLANEDIRDLNYIQLYLALYEIYARHGRRFYDVNLQAYFETKSWYKPLPKNETFPEKVLSDIERSNIIAIKNQMEQYEDEKKEMNTDYSNLSVDTMKSYLKQIYNIQKSYLYSFTLSTYYEGNVEFETCFLEQKKRLEEMFQICYLDVDLEKASNSAIRGMFMSLLQVGYVKDYEKLP